jgi:multimeric flavodoxin WrbA
MAAAYRKIRTADSLILSSPVFFGSVSAQVKMMVDRANFLWVARRGLKHKAAAAVKRGVFICAGGRDATRYFRNARKIVRIFFAVLGVRYSGEFLLDGLDSLGKNSPRVKRALKESYRLGAGLG